MSYYTEFSIRVHDSGKLSEEDALERLKVFLRDKDIIDFAVDDDLDCRESVKWYDEEKDMIAITNALGNDVIVVVEGHGEDSDDHWRSYYKNGIILDSVGMVWETPDLADVLTEE